MRKKTKIAFLGMGNLGLAQAGHMALEGYDVSLCNRSAEKLSLLSAADNCVYLDGVISGKGKLSLVTSSYKEAIADREVIIITTPASGHKAVVEQLLPWLKPNQQIILHPAYMMGAVVVHQLLARQGLGGIPVSEFSNALFACRANGVNVSVFAIKQKVGFASLPIDQREKCLEPLEEIYGDFIDRYDSVLETGMLNLNFMQHPFISIMNAGSIERGLSFSYYHSGVTPSVGRVIETANAEQLAVCEALGIRKFSAKELMKRHYPSNVVKEDNFYEACTTNTAYEKIDSPKGLYTRHIYEDIPYGIMPVVSLAQFLNIKTPTLKAIAQLCQAAFGKEWRNEARTLENLGLETLNNNELMAYFRTGKYPV